MLIIFGGVPVAAPGKAMCGCYGRGCLLCTCRILLGDRRQVLYGINNTASRFIDLGGLGSESAQKIKEATALITNIAEETNLLSLNASIEAARAGENLLIGLHYVLALLFHYLFHFIHRDNGLVRILDQGKDDPLDLSCR